MDNNNVCNIYIGCESDDCELDRVYTIDEKDKHITAIIKFLNKKGAHLHYMLVLAKKQNEFDEAIKHYKKALKDYTKAKRKLNRKKVYLSL